MGRKNAAACYRELGAQMRKLREAAGLTGRQVGLRTGWDPTRLSRIESGQVHLELSDLTWFLGVLRVKHDDAMPLIDLCRRAKAHKGHWLSKHGEWVPDSLSSLIYHESTATVSISYEPLLIPGLLQTERYARAMIGRQSWLSMAEIEAGVHLRMDRHRILSRRDCRFIFYIHEHALKLEVGSAAVMYEQMVALTLAAALPNVEVRLVPASGGGQAALSA